ncbi:unnamed protein product [Sphagnum compactum]
MFSFVESYGFGKKHGDNVIKGVINEILEGSTDTSITTIEWALAELLKHPKFMKKVQDELDDVIGQDRVIDESDIPQLKYFQAVVKETFCLHPPATLMIPHQNMEACEIGGRRICLGMLSGLLTVQMQLARLLHSFTWKLPKGENPQDLDMGEVFRITTRKAVPLHAIAIAQLPQHLYLAPQFT